MSTSEMLAADHLGEYSYVRRAKSALMHFRDAGMLAIAVPAALFAASAHAVLPTITATPNPSAPGAVTTFRVFCGSTADSATLFAFTLHLHDQIPMRKSANGVPGEFVVTVKLPPTLPAGTYKPSVACSNGDSGSVRLKVKLKGKPPASPGPSQPPATGDGTTATVTGTPVAVVGYGLIGIGAITGVVALRRRRASHRA